MRAALRTFAGGLDLLAGVIEDGTDLAVLTLDTVATVILSVSIPDPGPLS